jgi:DUF4097 and DUF4098 domain-containing protein YvlB
VGALQPLPVEVCMRWVVVGVLCVAVAASEVSAQSPVGFEWSGVLAAGKTIEIKGVNGAIRAELASGSQVEVRATKRSRRSDIASVSVQTVTEDGNVTICAMYPDAASPRSRSRREGHRRPNECRVGNAGHIGSRDNDVVVDFVVRVPAGVRFVGRTVNGSIDARGLKSDAEVRTVNGRIDLSTTAVGSATTVNGSIDASVGASTWTGELDFNTVNGSIRLRLPKDTNANLRAETMHGHFESEFPVAVQSFSGRKRRIVGVIGTGGRDLELETVNGSIDLRFVTD